MIDPTAALPAATEALQDRLEAAIGPVERCTEKTEEGAPYIGFAQHSTQRFVSVEPSENGDWEVVWQGRRESYVVSRAPTPIEAMERAEFGSYLDD